MVRLIICFVLLLFSLSTQAAINIHDGPRVLSGGKNFYITKNCNQYCNLIELYSSRYRVPTNLVIAVIYRESRFNRYAMSPKGAKGLMQLMDINSGDIDPFEPSDNIRKGTELLGEYLRKYNDLPLALAAYNAGPANVSKFNGVPPFNETKHYINAVLEHYYRLEN